MTMFFFTFLLIHVLLYGCYPLDIIITASKISVSAAGATSTTSGGSSVAASITTTTVVPGSSPAITPGGTAAPVTTKPKTVSLSNFVKRKTTRKRVILLCQTVSVIVT